MKSPSPHDRCGYCGCARERHNRPEAGNPAPSMRCARGCVCAAFIEADGRPDYQHAADGVQLAEEKAAALRVGATIPIRFIGMPGLRAEARITAIRGKILDIRYLDSSPIFGGLRGMVRLPGWSAPQ